LWLISISNFGSDRSFALKALNLMLNAQPFEFVIDLAILSSRREYLNLEKWIQDKIVEHREIFVNACVKFLQRSVPGIMGPAPLKEENIAKAGLPLECIAIILNSIEEAGKVIRMNQDLHETINEMANACAGVVARSAHTLPPGSTAGSVVGGQRPVQVNPGGAPGLPPNFNGGSTGTSGAAPAVGGPLPGGRQLPPGNLFQQGDIGNITRDIGSLNLSSGSAAVSSSAFSIPTLGPMVGSGPGSPSRLFASAGAGAAVGAPGSATPSSVGGTQSPFSGLVPPLGGPSGLSVGGGSIPSGLPGGGSIPSAPGAGGALTTGPPPPRPSMASNNPIEQVRQGNIASLFPEGDRNLSKEVEDEANSYFQRIYNTPPNPTLPIDEVLELLKKYKNSTVQRETDVFFCMIKNLFEEYKFFPQYPDNALFITAELFGGIIEHGLVTMIHLGVALRFVLDALRKPIDSNMSWFGLIALDRFKGRLKEYSQYCQHVASIAHFKEFPAHLVKWVEYGAQAQEPPGKPTAPVIPPARQNQTSSVPMAQLSQALASRTISTTTAITSTIVKPTTSSVGNRPSIANTSIDTLLAARRQEDDEITPPKEAEQDKIAFIFNNLSIMNLKEKMANLSDILDLQNNDNHIKWLAQYLVVNRASIEPNFHKTYSNFLEAFKSEKLYAQVIADTFKNIKILLDLDKTSENFKDRSLLKNQGHWLGLMLLARNKPILMVDLDMKQLIIEAYHAGQQENRQQELLFVVPFVAKVLESAKVSKVFKPPCPWTMGLMNLLAELHTEPELKLNLKFEIEVLCKHLSLEIAELRPGNVLKDYQRFEKFLSFKDLGASTTVSLSSEMKKPIKMQDTTILTQALGSSLTQVRLSEGKLQDTMTTMSMSSFNQSLGPSLTQAGNSNMPQLPSAAAFSQPGSGLGMMGAPPQQSILPTGQPDQLQKIDGTIPPVGVNRAAEPKFHFLEINTGQLSGLEPHITVDSRIQVVKEHPEMLELIKLAIEKSVTELMTPVIERAIKIAVTTCEQIVKKDFSLDHDENRMRGAAHKMVRNLTSGMAMITCRDHVLQKIKNHLKHILMSLGLRVMKVESIDPTVNLIANDNVELACAFIQKKAVEKAIPEIDKRLNVEFELRKLARKEGRRYCDPVAVTYQSERMPEPIRSKIGQYPAVQAKVYEEFARNIPGFKPLTDAEAATIFPKPDIPVGVNAPLSGSEESWAIIEEVYNKLQPYIESNTGLPGTPHQAGLQQLLEALKSARSSREVSSIIILIGKAVENLLEGLTVNVQAEPDMLARFRDANLLVLKALGDPRAFGPTWTNRQVTVALVEAREEIRWNIDAVDILIRSTLVNLFEYDKFLAACLEGNNPQALSFAMILAKIYLIDDRSNAQLIESDLFGTLEMLVQISNNSRNPPEGLVQLVDMIKINCERMEHNLQMSGPTSQLHSGIAQAREYEDPQGLLEKTEYLLREWVNMYHSPNAGKDSTKAFTLFVQQMNLHGLLKTDDLITRFFRMSTQMCVDLCYRALAEQNNAPSLVRAKCFHTLDAFVRLIALLVKHSGDQQNTITKVNLLNKVLGIVAGVLLIDHEVRRKEFQQVPYHRIFIMLYLELNAPDQILENINFQV
jgi:CCR4-NOT transcription complex subunit 1